MSVKIIITFKCEKEIICSIGSIELKKILDLYIDNIYYQILINNKFIYNPNDAHQLKNGDIIYIQKHPDMRNCPYCGIVFLISMTDYDFCNNCGINCIKCGTEFPKFHGKNICKECKKKY